MVTKKQIIDLIYQQCNESINLPDIRNAINIIIDKCIKEIVDDQIISVSNFGTLNVFQKRDGRLYNLQTRELFDFEGTRGVRFHASESLKKLAASKFEQLVEAQKERKSRRKPIDRTRFLRYTTDK